MQLRHLSDLSLDATRLVTVDGLHVPGGCGAALAVSSAVQR
jgi:hypothetical protein